MELIYNNFYDYLRIIAARDSKTQSKLPKSPYFITKNTLCRSNKQIWTNFGRTIT